jgi:predicted regulator of Ras-like GTPase activity (Roadblock/LC7/MglB family)
MPRHDTAPDAPGFHGDVTGLSLSDVIQLNGNNGFSGCITVQNEARVGRIFFRDGKIVHAEQGGLVGEAAFYELMEWSSGHFSLEPNISTTSHTIQKSTQFVLMEAHRLMDEKRAGRAASPPPAPAAPAKPPPMPGLTSRLRTLPGVRAAVLVGKDGRCAENPTAENDALAGRVAYLAMAGDRIGASLGTGEVRTIAARRSTEHLLVLVSRSQYLGLLIDGARDLPTVESEVVKVLGPTS